MPDRPKEALSTYIFRHGKGILSVCYRAHFKSINTTFYNNRKGIKIHACVSCDGFPLTIQIASGKEHYLQHFIEVIKGTVKEGNSMQAHN
ncbi:hypothetical protein [uncultured Methanomethylovorans sp.]|uniref:hypothetical protein n=1 Tax=uncultured Methanomethylovorans sp. TaxID=183759 RepID=UPI002AA7BFB0|nr:hypothetical protein [uncultured Methanomethylovorans sp.]